MDDAHITNFKARPTRKQEGGKECAPSHCVTTSERAHANTRNYNFIYDNFYTNRCHPCVLLFGRARALCASLFLVRLMRLLLWHTVLMNVLGNDPSEIESGPHRDDTHTHTDFAFEWPSRRMRRLFSRWVVRRGTRAASDVMSERCALCAMRCVCVCATPYGCDGFGLVVVVRAREVYKMLLSSGPYLYSGSDAACAQRVDELCVHAYTHVLIHRVYRCTRTHAATSSTGNIFVYTVPVRATRAHISYLSISAHCSGLYVLIPCACALSARTLFVSGCAPVACVCVCVCAIAANPFHLA